MSMKSNFRSKNGCVVCGRKSSTSRFKCSEPYKEFFLPAFGIDYRKGDFCNPCSLALNRYKKEAPGKRRDFSARVNKCRRNGQERKPKPEQERKKIPRKQACPKKREMGPFIGLPFPNARPTKPRRKRVATPDRPWMKYTNMWKPIVVHENGVQFDALVNQPLNMYLINADTARPCTLCAQVKTLKAGKEEQLESSPTHTTTLPPTPILQLPPSPSTSSADDFSPAASSSCEENVGPEMEGEEEMDEELELRNTRAENPASVLMNMYQAATSSVDEDKNLDFSPATSSSCNENPHMEEEEETEMDEELDHGNPSPSSSSVDEDKSTDSSSATSFSCKENVAPEMEEKVVEVLEEETSIDMELDLERSSVDTAAASALISICQAAKSDFYQQPPHAEKDAQRCLRAAPNQGIQPIPVGFVP